MERKGPGDSEVPGEGFPRITEGEFVCPRLCKIKIQSVYILYMIYDIYVKV